MTHIENIKYFITFISFGLTKKEQSLTDYLMIKIF